MNLILFDDDSRTDLLPLTYTRPVAELRIGILTIREKWEKRWQVTSSTLTAEYLSGKFPLHPGNDNLLLNGGLLPDPELIRAIEKLEIGQALFGGAVLLALRTDRSGISSFQDAAVGYDKIPYSAPYGKVSYPWQVFSMNAGELESDFAFLTAGRKSEPLSSTNTLLEKERIFAEEGAMAECSVLNARSGPIYLGHQAEIMEGSLVRGGLALGDHSTLKLGAKIYGATTIGPHCKIGGEVSNTVVLGYSNKAHDGFLGNSVIGEWCNLGADTNNSNLKNNYAEVKLWSYRKNGFIPTGLQFCGLIMGDHSKCGINTMFNTGTVVGVSANIFGSGFPRNLIPSFSWGGAHGFETFGLNKAFEVAQRVMERRGLSLDETEKQILSYLFTESAGQRYWEPGTSKA